MLLSKDCFIGVITSLLLIATTACTTDTSELIEESRFKIDEGKYEEALVYLNEAIDENPSLEAYLLRGTAFFNLGDNQRAMISFTQASEISPDDYRAWMNLGNIHVQVRQFPAALSNYNRAIGLNGGIGKLYMNRGNVQFQQKNYKEAILDFTSAIEIDSSDFQPWFNRGRAQYMTRNFDQALISFEGSLHLAESAAESRYWMGVCFHQLGNSTKSCENLKIASDLGEPNAKTAFLSLCAEKE